MINQKQGKQTASLGFGIFFFSSINLDATVALAKDAQRPVRTDKVCDFVIPTLYFLEPYSFGGFSVHWNSMVWGLLREMETVWGWLLLSSFVVPLSLAPFPFGFSLTFHAGPGPGTWTR